MLLENLYGMREGANQNNSLNNLIFRLRKHLLALGCSQSDDIVIKNGRCWLISKEKICLDVLEFKKLLGMAEPAMGEEKEKLLVQALALYQGELLPQISTEMWVMAESLELKQYFERAVNTLGKLWGNQKKYRQLLPVYTKAAQIYPFENWQTQLIRCNVEMYRYEEAFHIYNDTMELYTRELGNPPMADMQKCFEGVDPLGDSHNGNAPFVSSIKKHKNLSNVPSIALCITTGLCFSLSSPTYSSSNLSGNALADGTPHVLAVTQSEKEAISFSKLNCAATVAVINSSNVMQIGELLNGEYECDAVLWVGGPGEYGIRIACGYFSRRSKSFRTHARYMGRRLACQSRTSKFLRYYI